MPENFKLSENALVSIKNNGFGQKATDAKPQLAVCVKHDNYVQSPLIPISRCIFENSLPTSTPSSEIFSGTSNCLGQNTTALKPMEVFSTTGVCAHSSPTPMSGCLHEYDFPASTNELKRMDLSTPAIGGTDFNTVSAFGGSNVISNINQGNLVYKNEIPIETMNEICYCIPCMWTYLNLSFEEVRLKDYSKQLGGNSTTDDHGVKIAPNIFSFTSNISTFNSGGLKNEQYHQMIDKSTVNNPLVESNLDVPSKGFFSGDNFNRFGTSPQACDIFGANPIGFDEINQTNAVRFRNTDNANDVFCLPGNAMPFKVTEPGRRHRLNRKIPGTESINGLASNNFSGLSNQVPAYNFKNKRSSKNNFNATNPINAPFLLNPPTMHNHKMPAYCFNQVPAYSSINNPSAEMNFDATTNQVFPPIMFSQPKMSKNNSEILNQILTGSIYLNIIENAERKKRKERDDEINSLIQLLLLQKLTSS